MSSGHTPHTLSFVDGEQVEYLTDNAWVSTRVKQFDAATGLYMLECKRGAKPEKIRKLSTMQGNGGDLARPEKSRKVSTVQDNGDDLARVVLDEGYQDQLIKQYEEFMGEAKNRKQTPWDALRERFAPTPEVFATLAADVQRIFPFISDPGVSYDGFRRRVPNRSKSSGHVLFCF